MDFWGSLKGFQADVSGDIDAVQAKIRLLRKANSRIAGEQGEGQNEVKNIIQPRLESEWKGARANRFKTARNAAYRDMVKVFKEEYEEYQTQISAEISRLEIQLAFLNAKMMAAAAVEETANEISHSLDDAKDQLADAGNRLNELRKGLF
ncbi:DUF5082 domain-containing protein [Bacillus mangrovi]|uniref:DUF5082 domain-containing protein n=1 Tax=Metabacillus mangrovi TaxID=1491830 RepID=A0A7X2V6B6_9BACI|nr:DUF5082 family protein [Metabacillus mangrovi]MTH55081.1 DUF5082 domain-containing protein [Metabacillus mangrovi]